MATILVVDDSAVVRRMLALVLGRNGHGVRFATNGEEALQAMRSELPDLVITDLEMPVMDGIALVRALRAEWPPTLPVVMLTASGEAEHHRAAAGLRIDGFATKPVQSGEVASLVSRLLDGSP